MRTLVLFAGLLGAFAAHSKADVVLTFEGVAPPGSLVNVNPAAPYHESGFTLTPSNANSAVFDAGAVSKFAGDSTSWFGFASNNLITLTGPVAFDLESMLIGPSTIGSGVINFTITGQIFGGGSVSVTYNNLTTATDEVIGFTDLQSAVFSATSDAGIDNVALAAVPEPRSLPVLAGCLIGLAAISYRRKLPSRK
jgi:hypothetical protein